MLKYLTLVLGVLVLMLISFVNPAASDDDNDLDDPGYNKGYVYSSNIPENGSSKEYMEDSGEVEEGLGNGEYMQDSGEMRDEMDNGEYMTDSGEVRDKGSE